MLIGPLVYVSLSEEAVPVWILFFGAASLFAPATIFAMALGGIAAASC